MLRKMIIASIAILGMITMSGCANRVASTPATMSYDGSSVDYSTIDTLKNAKVCKKLTDASGDTTIITAAKKAGISKIVHVDTSFESTSFLMFTFGAKSCVTVYGN